MSRDFLKHSPTRYFIGGDDSGHNYLVPVEYREDWLQWEDLQGQDPDTLNEAELVRAWNAPDYARRIDNYTTITFVDPQEI